jgi:phosphoglycerate dehydrogenase-like enzyme
MAGEGDVDQIYPASETTGLLAESDFVVLAVPMTPQTRHVINEAALRAMKSTAYLINVGRGGLIDETALVSALESGEIAGAGLDVFGEEPLPSDSSLWDAPNLLMTPHVSGDLVDHRVRTARFFCEQLGRYLAGEPVRNVIDPDRGY